MEQNYMFNKKIKEEVDKNQKNYTQEEEPVENQTPTNNDNNTEENSNGPHVVTGEAGGMIEEEGEW